LEDGRKAEGRRCVLMESVSAAWAGSRVSRKNVMMFVVIVVGVKVVLDTIRELADGTTPPPTVPEEKRRVEDANGEEMEKADDAAVEKKKEEKQKTEDVSTAEAEVKEKKSSLETIHLAAGCFWSVELMFQRKEGVSRTRVGYTQGDFIDPTYDVVKLGNSGHVETVEVTFDPSLVALDAILEAFWGKHDPTTKNKQGMTFIPSLSLLIFCVFLTASHSSSLLILRHSFLSLE
jgi:hypothetical protein